MEVKILWSAFSEKDLKNIFNFYSKNASTQVALKIIQGITNRVKVLLKHPYCGQKEELLDKYKLDFRYLVEGNYKIIYLIKGNEVIIASVFDSRQNPKKIEVINP